jgi:hypothetical protein
MSFANDTPLEDVLKYIKSATQGPNDNGIPIYVDPVGLQEAEKTMTSPITLDLEGVPLKTTLRLLLKQIGMTYTVKDGMLTITAESSEDQPTEIRVYPVADLAIIPISLMGGQAGGGGMGGGGMGGSGHHGRHSQDAAGGNAGTNATASGNPRLHANALIIRQSEVVFDIAANGQRMAYRFDNRNNYGAPYGGTVTLTWATPEIVIETHPDGGGSVEEHYSLSPDGKRLSLHIREQRQGEATARETTRAFVRNNDDASATSATLPP